MSAAVSRVAWKRKGCDVHLLDTVTTATLRVRASSAPEARDFVERLRFWLARMPVASLGEVVPRVVREHESALVAQRRRRFGSCFVGAPR